MLESQRREIATGMSFSGFERDYLAINVGSRAFVNISGVSGIDSITDGRASVFADFDNDGDLDVFLMSRNEPHWQLFRNNIGNENDFLRVSLVGSGVGGRDAIGAVVRVRTPDMILSKVNAVGSGFLSQHDPRLIFGLGKSSCEDVEIVWPDGTRQQTGRVPPNSWIEVTKGRGYQQVIRKKTLLPDPLDRSERIFARLSLERGAKIPDLWVTDAGEGRPRSVRQMVQGTRRKLICFWAMSCPRCRADLHQLQEASDRLEKAGIDILALHLGEATDAELREFLRHQKIAFPTYSIQEPGSLGNIYLRNEVFTPLLLLFDDRGTLSKVFSKSQDVLKEELVSRD